MTNDEASILIRLAASSSERVHLGRFIAGVFYAIEEYDRLAIVAPKQTQTGEFYSQELLDVLSAIESPTPPPTNWLRGFFFNAAIMRLDAAWERALRIILSDTSKNSKGPDLYNRVYGVGAYTGSIFERIRTEVSALKHNIEGPKEDIREKKEVLLDGLAELLNLVKERFL
jgi:hypothetical protein